MLKLHPAQRWRKDEREDLENIISRPYQRHMFALYCMYITTYIQYGIPRFYLRSDFQKA